MRGMLALLILTALTATILIGCGAGSSGSSQPSAEQQDSETTGSSKAEPPEQKAAAGQLEHPTLGSADAPVVMTEYSDYQ